MTDPYQEQVRTLRASNRLHSAVEARLAALLKRAFPDAAGIPEVSAVLGGRNDLLQYFFNGRRAVFEIFSSASQMSQDLRLLEQCDAAVKIAVLIDPEIDASVSKQYFRKKPHAFPYLWLTHIIDPRWEAITVARLRELIDENHSIVRLRRLVTGRHAESVDRMMRELLDKLESHLYSQASSAPPELTGKQWIALRVVELVKNKGVPVERLRSLFQWLCESVEHAVEIVGCGLQAFLVTDLESRHAVWSDGDLADDLIICSPLTPKAEIVMCLNPIINEYFTQTGHSPIELQFHFFHSYREFIERVIPKSSLADEEPTRDSGGTDDSDHQGA